MELLEIADTRVGDAGQGLSLVMEFVEIAGTRAGDAGLGSPLVC
jgi:hypothetical protein